VSERLILASASPRRALILRSLGIPFRVIVSGIEEVLREGETAEAAATRLAREKAEDVARSHALPVLGADTVVVISGRILGKPRSPEDARDMLRALSGAEHHVITGLCLVSGGRARTAACTTTVRVAPLTDAEIVWYVGTGEPMDKAGAYHIDGRGALFIDEVQGSPSNVAGLPVRLLYSMAREAGVSLTSDL
jgi:septum formation protein